jgi:hypothetical protein
MHPRWRTAFKIPLGSSVLSVWQPQPQPFKYFALEAMGQRKASFILNTPLEDFVQLHAPTDLPLERNPTPLSIFMRLLVPVRMQWWWCKAYFSCSVNLASVRLMVQSVECKIAAPLVTRIMWWQAAICRPLSVLLFIGRASIRARDIVFHFSDFGLSLHPQCS